MHTEFSRFVVFWAGSSICLAYLTASLVNRGLIGWGEYGTTIAAYSCIFLIVWDLLFLIEYMSVLYEMDEGEEKEWACEPDRLTIYANERRCPQY